MSASPPSHQVAPDTRTLSEPESKRLLAEFGVPFANEELVATPAAAGEAANRVGLPAVVKLYGDAIAHKTERGLVRLDLRDEESVTHAAGELLALATQDDGEVGLLVAPMLRATRELIVGVATDAQFGTTVVVGVGGILAEAIADVSIRLVPITTTDAEEMLDELDTQALLGAFRGEPALDRSAMVALLVSLSEAAVATPELVSADCNPVLVVDGRPVAVDALVEVSS